VDEKVTAQSACRVVVYAACAIGDVAHDEGFSAGAKLSEDVGNCGCEEQESFRKLESYAFCAGGADAMDGFRNLERVIFWEEVDGGENVRVLGYFRRNLI
jgi:hypothetical protein